MREIPPRTVVSTAGALPVSLGTVVDGEEASTVGDCNVEVIGSVAVTEVGGMVVVVMISGRGGGEAILSK